MAARCKVEISDDASGCLHRLVYSNNHTQPQRIHTNTHGAIKRSSLVSVAYLLEAGELPRHNDADGHQIGLRHHRGDALTFTHTTRPLSVGHCPGQAPLPTEQAGYTTTHP